MGTWFGIVAVLAVGIQASSLMLGSRLYLGIACGILGAGWALLALSDRKALARLVLVVFCWPAAWLGFSILPLSGWPWGQLAPLSLVLLLSPLMGGIRSAFGWRLGRLKGQLRWILPVALVSSAALVVWFGFFQDRLASFAEQLPDVGLPALLALGAGFSVINAAMEELYFRGALYVRMEGQLPAGWLLFLQATSFAAIHFVGGVPNGIWGFGMTLAYGLMLGGLRWKAQGLISPWLAHVVADACIFAGILTILRA